MARKMKKFADGGATKARYDRKVADIESDYAKWQKSGKYGNAGTAKAKYEQRMADAKDDLAKWTGGDRTATSAAEKASESALSEARRTKGRSMTNRDLAESALSKIGGDKPLTTTNVNTGDIAKAVAPKTFGEAFRQARQLQGAGKTFTWQGKSYTTDMAGDKKPAASRSGTSSAPSRPAASTPARSAPPVKTVVAAAKAAPPPPPAARPNVKPTAATTAAVPTVTPDTEDFSRFGQSAGSRAAFVKAQAAKKAAADKALSGQKAKDAQARAAFQAAINSNKSLEAPAILRAPGAKKGGAIKKPVAKKPAKKNCGGSMKKYAKGGSIDGIAIRGKTRVKRVK